MRKLLILLTFLLSFKYSQEFHISETELVKREGIFYKLDNYFIDKSTSPYSGKVFYISVYGNVNYVKYEYSLIDGKKHGQYIMWYKGGGHRESEGNYKEGKKNGTWKYFYKNGVIESQGNYKDGEKDGTWIYKYYLYPEVIKSQGNYKDGKKNGTWKKYDKEGRLEEETKWENGNKGKTKTIW